jgi:hypothetical protein
MADEKDNDILWLPEPEEHNYPAAASYLGLLHADQRVAQLITELKAAALVEYKAKDILRASRLSPVGMSNAHVEKDRRKIRNGVALSPLLLVRDEADGKVVVADGYHRLCAIYALDEDAWIRCKIV